MISSSGGVCVFVEHTEREIKESSLLVICEGRRLAERLKEELSVILLGKELRTLIPQLSVYGVGKVFLFEDGLLEKYIPEIYTDILCEIATRYTPSVILFGTTSMGNDLASRVASRLKKGIITNCKEFYVDKNGDLKVRKPILDEKVDAVVTFLSGKPYIATVNPNFLELEKTKERKETQIIEIKPQIKEDRIRVLPIDHIKIDPKTVEVDEADVVVGVGAGLGSEEYLKVINELADLLSASIGGSRVARDKGWIPYSRQIGSSGKKIAPRLYVAIGISGSHHHTDGIRDSKLIVAINTDRKAPILKIADLGIVGDFREVIPALNDMLREVIKSKVDERSSTLMLSR
jgi:electron transfer flavoprotein alpha subunit